MTEYLAARGDAQRELAENPAVSHRISSPDLLLASIASQHGLGVLHYDSDYDLLAEHTSLDVRERLDRAGRQRRLTLRGLRGDGALGATGNLGGAARALADPEMLADRQLVLAQQRTSRIDDRAHCGSRIARGRPRPFPHPRRSRAVGTVTSLPPKRPSLTISQVGLAAAGVDEVAPEPGRRRRCRSGRSPSRPTARTSAADERWGGSVSHRPGAPAARLRRSPGRARG